MGISSVTRVANMLVRQAARCEMGISSVTRVANMLVETDDFKAYLGACERVFENLDITRFEFESRDVGRPETRFYVTAFKLEFCNFQIRLNNFGSSEFRNFIHKLIHPGDVFENVVDFFEVFERNLGTKVKTFNCGRDKLKTAYKDRGLTLIDERFRNRMTLKIAWLNARAQEIISTEEYALKAKTAYEQQTIKEVKQVLLRFRDAETHILRQALEEFVCADVVDC